jgi:hypothetical protein
MMFVHLEAPEENATDVARLLILGPALADLSSTVCVHSNY